MTKCIAAVLYVAGASFELYALLAIAQQSKRAEEMLNDATFDIIDGGNASGHSDIEAAPRRVAANQRTSRWVMAALGAGILCSVAGNFVTLWD